MVKESERLQFGAVFITKEELREAIEYVDNLMGYGYMGTCEESAMAGLVSVYWSVKKPYTKINPKNAN